MKIIGAEWKTGGTGTVGVVLTENDGRLVAYIGCCKGDSEEGDKRLIADYGAKLRFHQAKAFFPYITEGSYDE